MTKRKKGNFSEGDILMLPNDRMIHVQYISAPHCPDYVLVDYVDSSEIGYLDPEKLEHAMNLGSSKEVLATFWATRSIHVRLNRIKDI
jgi:hypothetical protein